MGLFKDLFDTIKSIFGDDEEKEKEKQITQQMMGVFPGGPYWLPPGGASNPSRPTPFTPNMPSGNILIDGPSISSETPPLPPPFQGFIEGNRGHGFPPIIMSPEAWHKKNIQ